MDVKLWDSEGNPSQVGLQYQSPPGTGTWTDATLLTIAGQPAAANLSLAAPPSGATHQVLWNTVQNLGTSFNGGVLLRARATDSSGAGAWSEPMFYAVNVTGDFDQDGMTDGWEIANNLDPNDASDATADPDGDGFSNRMEFSADTNPHNPASVFRVTNIARTGTSVTLTWSSVSGKIYVVQSAAVPGGTWNDVPGANVTANSASTNFTLTGINANAAYFRVRIAP